MTIVAANVRCNACQRSLVGVSTANFGKDSQCKPHGFACGLYGYPGGPQPSMLDHLGMWCHRVLRRFA